MRDVQAVKACSRWLEAQCTDWLAVLGGAPAVNIIIARTVAACVVMSKNKTKKTSLPFKRYKPWSRP